MILKGRRLLPALPLTQPLLQIQRTMNLLLTRPAEQNQRQLRRGQRIGTRVMPFEHFKLEPLDPLIQPGLANVRLWAHQRRNVGDIQNGVRIVLDPVRLYGVAFVINIQRAPPAR